MHKLIDIIVPKLTKQKMQYIDDDVDVYNETTKMLINSFLISLSFLILIYIYKNNWFVLSPMIATPIIFSLQIKSIDNQYRRAVFTNEYNFSQFVGLLNPLLMIESWSVNKALSTLLDKTSGIIKHELLLLIEQLNENPNQIEPFLNFATNIKVEDAEIYMICLYNYQQHINDTSVLKDLSKRYIDRLMRNMQEVVKFKIKKFAFFTSKVTMSALIPTIGFLGYYLFEAFMNIGGQL